MVLEIVLGVVAIAVTFLSYYLSIKNTIRKHIGDAINSAEETDKIGAEKMAIAVEQVYSLVPPILKSVFTKEVLSGLIQEVFDKMQEFAQKQVGGTKDAD